jgi:bis(5'-nucleosyl)-tetraphosphatase (symmetrical)
MAEYAIGDIQGCALPLEELLEKLHFEPGRDRIWLTGDLVNRGPDSLQTLRFVRKLGSSAITVLGNHDLHFLAIAEKIRRNRSGDTLKQIRKAPDLEELVNWLRQQPLVHCDRKLRVIMVHAGIYPGWGRKQLIRYAREVEEKLQGKQYCDFLRRMYGKNPVQWNKNLKGWDRSRFITNSLTRMRYCNRKGMLNFSQKGPPGSQPGNLIPWYSHPGMRCKKWRIVFGHWSSLGYFQNKNIISLDSGCVWGGKLTAVRLDADYVAPYWQLKCHSQNK